jgi:hypothetical protein
VRWLKIEMSTKRGKNKKEKGEERPRKFETSEMWHGGEIVPR